jgi:hypothetical protein
MPPLSVHSLPMQLPPMNQFYEPLSFQHPVYPMPAHAHPTVRPMGAATPPKEAKTSKESFTKKIWNRLTGKKNAKPPAPEPVVYIDPQFPPLMVPGLGESLMAHLRQHYNQGSPEERLLTERMLAEELRESMPSMTFTDHMSKKTPLPQQVAFYEAPPAYHPVAQAHEISINPEQHSLENFPDTPLPAYSERPLTHALPDGEPPPYRASEDESAKSNQNHPKTEQFPFINKPLPPLPLAYTYPDLLTKPLPHLNKPLPPLPNPAP